MLEEHTNTSIACRKANLTPEFPFLFVYLDVLTNNLKKECQSDVWLTVHRNSVWIRKTN